VIAWTHGTWGVAERCAPSLSPSFWTSTPGLAETVRAGYVVVAPDYIGLGSPGPHPLLVGPPTAHAVLDAVRAASGIPGAAAGKIFALWGESQGGHAALWTTRLAPSYAPDLRLVGTVAAAPPTDLARNMALGADRNARAMLTSMTAWSWSQLYGAPMETFGRRPLQNVMLRLAQNNCIELNGKPRLGTVLGVITVANALKRVDLTRSPVWSRIMRENSAAPLSGPLMIVQGGRDQVVAPEVTRSYAQQACRAGARLRYVDLPGEDHVSATRASVRQALDWIGARFAGERAPSDCGRI
jgi:pimeloyl-ACP methyl ester carboxylesterase